MSSFVAISPLFPILVGAFLRALVYGLRFISDGIAKPGVEAVYNQYKNFRNCTRFEVAYL